MCVVEWWIADGPHACSRVNHAGVTECITKTAKQAKRVHNDTQSVDSMPNKSY